MKTPSSKAFTLVEMLFVILIVAGLAVILLPALMSHRGPARPIRCWSNQHKIAIALVVWSSDHANKFPWQVAATNGGALEAATRGYAAPNFRCLSNYVHDTKICICPGDTNRVAAANFAHLYNLNISYFISLDSSTNPSASILTGDRNLADDGKPLKAGLFVQTPVSKMSWTRQIHLENHKTPLGFCSFADGHVQGIGDADLDSFFLRENLATNRLCIP